MGTSQNKQTSPCVIHTRSKAEFSGADLNPMHLLHPDQFSSPELGADLCYLLSEHLGHRANAMSNSAWAIALCSRQQIPTESDVMSTSLSG